jgi:hypothetical protein
VGGWDCEIRFGAFWKMGRRLRMQCSKKQCDVIAGMDGLQASNGLHASNGLQVSNGRQVSNAM